MYESLIVEILFQYFVGIKGQTIPKNWLNVACKGADLGGEGTAAPLLQSFQEKKWKKIIVNIPENAGNRTYQDVKSMYPELPSSTCLRLRRSMDPALS